MAERVMNERETYSFLKASNLFPSFHVFASGLQELLVGQVEGLPNGQSYLLRLQQQGKGLTTRSSLTLLSFPSFTFTDEELRGVKVLHSSAETRLTHFSLSNT